MYLMIPVYIGLGMFALVAFTLGVSHALDAQATRRRRRAQQEYHDTHVSRFWLTYVLPRYDQSSL